MEKYPPISEIEAHILAVIQKLAITVLQMLMMVVAPVGIADAGAQMYHFVPGIFDKPTFDHCQDNCPYPGLIAKGDTTGLTVTGRHHFAERSRAARSAFRKSIRLRDRLGDMMQRIADKLAQRPIELP